MLASIDYCFSNLWPYFSYPEIKQSPFDKVKSLDELAQILISDKWDLDRWLMHKTEIKSLIDAYRQNLNELDSFLQKITEFGIEKDPQKTMAIIVDFVSLDLLTQIVSCKQEKSETPFTNIFDWAAEHAALYPANSAHSLKTRIYSEWKKCRPIVLYFIPNLINVFLGAFNFIDSHKKFTTLWEKHLLLEIIYKFFIIPYCLIKVLQPVFIVTVKVYVVAALIIIATGILVSAYQRWLRPLPDEIVNCVNLDKQMAKGLLEPKVGQAKELELLIAALELDSNILLIGNSGDGKTALVHHFIQKKHEGQLSEKLQKYTAFEVDCGLVVSSYGFGYSEVINQIKEQSDGYDEALFFFDEFDKIATNKEAFKAFKKRFLEDKPHSKFIAAITFKEFNEVKKIDLDGSFRRRVTIINLQSNSDEQNRLILREWVNRQAKDVPVSDEAIEAVLEKSKLEGYLPGIGRPAKAIKILMNAIVVCRAAYNPHYASEKLCEARQELQNLQQQAIHHVKVDGKILKKIRDQRQKIQNFEKELKQHKREVAKIKKLMEQQQKLNANYYHLTHLLASAVAPQTNSQDSQNNEKEDDLEGVTNENRRTEVRRTPKPPISKESIGEDVQIMYLWYYFYAIDAMKKILQDKIDGVKTTMFVQVDKTLIEKIYEESKKLEDNLYAAGEKTQLMQENEISPEEGIIVDEDENNE
jgi:hypothetical protein